MGYIAVAKICQNRTVHLPKSMMLHINAKIGDSLEFYPASMRVDETEMSLNDMVLIKVKEGEK